MPFLRHLILSIGCLLLAVPWAGAATPGSPIASLNARKLLSDSQAAKDALARFQADFVPRENALQSLGASLKEKSAELEKLAPSLAPAQVLSRQKEVDDLAREFQRKQQQFIEDRDARKREDIQQVFAMATQAAIKYAQDAHLDIVFQDVVYANPANDITAKVIAIMDAQSRK